MRKLPMMIAAAGALVALSGCGSTDTTRTATGGAGGVAAGALVGGPVGAVVGGVGGAAAGATMDEGLEKKAQDMTSNDNSSSTTTGRSSRQTAARGSEYRSPLSAERVRTIQQALNDRTDGRDVSVDGIWGPNTRRALRQFQRDNNLRATGQINAETLSALNLNDQTGTGGQDNGGRTTGGTAPAGQSGASGTGNPETGTTGTTGTAGQTNSQPQ
ncbi:peptidoglycan-binding domain-containing protein [Azospirillum thermophilum]|uniref:Peptidoglycan binding-like domain-containing protein n=1 Tax=Azospirillum thermophilum TaxID=2202148 RepID=A0A2S2CLC4_9PROT|nr:peptidoglycan-binding domain-containing protein [Azospirillum thermophilum]AWK85315.1 hypothetical protein DEW08_03200 [Azospirillum thermophilum]